MDRMEHYAQEKQEEFEARVQLNYERENQAAIKRAMIDEENRKHKIFYLHKWDFLR